LKSKHMRFHTFTVALGLAVALLLFAQRRQPPQADAQFRTVMDLTAARAPQTQLVTRIQAPANYLRGTWTVDQIPAARLVGTLVVLDVRDHARRNPAYEVSPYDIGNWERAHGPVPPGSIVVARTADARQRDLFATFSPDTIQFLVEGRNVIAIGTDSPVISRNAQANTYAAAHGLYELTNIAGLATAPEAGGAAIVAPPLRAGATEAEARILALVR
jgi:kynurenine formamidase